MKIRLYIGATLLIIISLFISCATNDPSSLGWRMRHIRVYSTPNLNIKECRLRIIPFKSELPATGQSVSDSIGALLLDSAVSVVTRDTDARYLLTGTVPIGSVARGGWYRHLGSMRSKEYIAGVTCQMTEISTGRVVMNVTYKKAVDLHKAVPLGELLAEAIKRTLRGKPLPPIATPTTKVEP